MNGRLDGHAVGGLAEAAQEKSRVDRRVIQRFGKWDDMRSDNLNASVEAPGQPYRRFQSPPR